MNISLPDPDDPRLTAYALGELPEGADRAAIEQLLVHSPEARASVEEIRSLAALLVAEYESDRVQADGADMPGEQVNLIPFPLSSQAVSKWRGNPWLSLAALLLILGTLAFLLLPVVSRVNQRTAVAVSKSPPLPAAASSALAQPASVARADQSPVASASPTTLLALNKDASRASSTRATLPSDIALSDIATPPTPQTTGEIAAASRAESDHTQRIAPPLQATGQISPAEPQAPAQAQSADQAQSQDLLAQAAPPAMNETVATSRLQDTTTAYAHARSDSTSRVGPGVSSRNAARRPPPANTSIPAKEKSESPGPAGKPLAYSGNYRARGGATNSSQAVTAPVSVDADQSASDQRPGISSTAAPTMPAPAQAKAGVRPETDRDEFAMLGPSQADKDSAFNTATYDHVAETPFLSAKENPLSTFSLDVDTASYSNVRRFIEAGTLPPADAVRIEEMLNYFPYADAPPSEGDPHPFAIHLEAATCPWNLEHRLVRIGIKGREIAQDKRPPSNLVFLIDVSGSMSPPERLPLIKDSLRLLVEKLTADDRVAIVVYAGSSGLALPPTSGDQKIKILDALDQLEAGGSTNGAEGIQLAYKVARQNFIKGGVNRVILATDGDFNVGITSQGALVRLIEKEAKSGVFLSALGVGTDNYKDSTMQKLADHGNGNYAYIDRLEEARKVLVEQMSGTLVTIAKDVKIQVEFNPATVASYRLIGYEKRLLRKEDFNDDKVDAGEIGAGHNVTAFYEIIPAGQAGGDAAPGVDGLKYQSPALAAAVPPVGSAPELLTLKMRYKAPEADKSERSDEQSLIDHPGPGDFARASNDFKFASAVVGFGLTLRDSPYKGNLTLGAIVELAQDGKGPDASGYRAQFIDLVRRAQALEDESR